MRECVNEHFKPFLDTAHVLGATPTELELSNFTHSLEMNIELSMIDGKMANIQGDSGSFFHYCKVSRLDIFRIQEGFQVEKSDVEVLETWEQLQSGELQYSNPQRAGQCHKPMTQ